MIRLNSEVDNRSASTSTKVNIVKEEIKIDGILASKKASSCSLLFCEILNSPRCWKVQGEESQATKKIILMDLMNDYEFIVMFL